MGRGLVFILLLVLLAAPAFAGDDEQHLAVLAANMRSLGDSSYALDCGPVEPSDSVITALPAEGIETEYYCVMRKGTDIIIGTFLEAPAATDNIGEDVLPILETVYDDSYKPHIQDSNAPLEEMCDIYALDNDKFQECDETIRAAGEDLSIYMYKTGDDPVIIYVIITDSEDVDDLIGDPTVFSEIGDFFKRIFGVTTSPPQFISNPEFKEFHHAFFAKEGTHEIVATWYGTSASIVYKNFVTDFYTLMPAERAEIKLGHDNQQMLRMDLKSGQVALWRRLTVGIDASETPGERVTGKCGAADVGGSNAVVIGFDEDCEQGTPITATCQAYKASNGQRYSGGMLGCSSQCTLDFNGCELCIDSDGDGFFNNTPGLKCSATRFDCNDTNQMINNSATEICDNGLDDDCNPQTSDVGTVGPCQGYVSPPVFICNFDGVADDAESDSCRDRLTADTQCPTPAVTHRIQGKYNITTRADPENGPQLIIKLMQYNKSCLLEGGTISASSVAEGTWPLYTDISGHRILLNSTNTTWTIIGDDGVDPGNSESLKQCWGTQNNNGFDLRIDIPKNPTPTCTPRTNACVPRGGGCILDADCCSGTTTSWCEQGTCQREYINPCTDEQVYSAAKACRPEHQEVGSY